MSIINPLVVDLSHWDTVTSYRKVKEAGIAGVIYKATQGTGYRDDTYKEAKKQALGEGLLWGSYHFADGTNPEKQAANYLNYADIGIDDLFCLDYEDNNGDAMAYEDTKIFAEEVESALGREGDIVLYSGNTIKENIKKGDNFWPLRRLWLAQYGMEYVLPPGYVMLWLWQFTGDGIGPLPHSIDGIEGEELDINSYDGSAEDLAGDWPSNLQVPAPTPIPPLATICPHCGATINIVVS